MVFFLAPSGERQVSAAASPGPPACEPGSAHPEPRDHGQGLTLERGNGGKNGIYLKGLL